MKTIGIGLIGAGNIAQFHMQGYNSIREAYGEYIPHFVVVADQNIKAAESIRDRYGYETATTDWHDVISNPAVDVVLITSPNFLHAEMVIAAANAGKHVMCEKPMAMNKEEGKAMCEAIDKAGVTSLIDFIYLKCPTVVETRRMIEAGELGDIITFRGWFDSGYKADPDSPMEWRQYKKLAGTGALGDITAHVISLSDYLVNGQLGGIEEVCAAWDIVIPERSDGKNPDSRVPVDTDDLNYVLIRYKNGRLGIMYSTRVAIGHDCRLGFEIHGSKGSAEFAINRMNELVVYNEDGKAEEKGFKTLSPNTKHGDFKHYSIYDDIGISYSNVMGIQAQHFMKAIDTHTPTQTDVHYGYYVDRVMDAIIKSIEEKRWVKISEML